MFSPLYRWHGMTPYCRCYIQLKPEITRATPTLQLGRWPVVPPVSALKLKEDPWTILLRKFWRSLSLSSNWVENECFHQMLRRRTLIEGCSNILSEKILLRTREEMQGLDKHFARKVYNPSQMTGTIGCKTCKVKNLSLSVRQSHTIWWHDLELRGNKCREKVWASKKDVCSHKLPRQALWCYG